MQIDYDPQADAIHCLRTGSGDTLPVGKYIYVDVTSAACLWG
jgi:uncharacterized protein YuzE